MSAIMLKRKLKATFYAPLTQDGQQIDVQDIVAIGIRNAGTSTVNIQNGLWTLDSKETLSVNVTEDGGFLLDLTNLTITFDTSTGVVNKLQYFVLRASDEKTMC